MLISELKEITKDLPDDADVIMQKYVNKKVHMVAAVLDYRLSTIKDEEGNPHCRLILINDKPLKYLFQVVRNERSIKRNWCSSRKNHI